MTFLGPPSQNRRLPRLRLRRAWRPVRCAFAVGVALLLGIGAAEAQSTTKLVGNTGQSTGSQLNFDKDRRQSFTVGSSPATLTHVEIELFTGSGTKPTFNVSIRKASSFGTNLGTLTSAGLQSNGDTRFTASSPIGLESNTQYYVFIDVTADGSGVIKTRGTSSDAEDAGRSIGWSIGNSHHHRATSGSGNWTSSSTALKVAIYGKSFEPTADGWTVMWRTSKAIQTRPCALPQAFTITVDGTAYFPNSAACNASYVRMTMPAYGSEIVDDGVRSYPVGAIHPGQTVKLSYDKSEARLVSAGMKLTYTDGTEVANFTSASVNNVTRWAQTEGATGQARAMSIQFDRNLNPNPTPDGEDFQVETEPEDGASGDRGKLPEGFRGATARAASGGGARRTIAGTGPVSIDGRTLTVTLTEAVGPGEKLRVTYSPKTKATQLHDDRAIPVPAFSNLHAANATRGENSPATGAPAITGEARVGKTLEASTDGIEDTDGLTGSTFAYQWLANGTDIAGATEATYTLAESDEGAAITVRVTFTDDAGNEETLTSAATDAVAPPLPPLTASFHDVPAEHDGESEFSFELRFSENFAGELSPETLRDRALKTTYASVTQVARMVSGENQRWTITVRPDGAETATVSLPATTDCAADGAVCTSDGRPLSNATTATVAAAVPDVLTASFVDVPSEHGGQGTEFSFELRFSEDFGGKLPYRILRDKAITATNGKVTRAKRVAQNQNQRWTITVEPESREAVTVSLAATTECGGIGAICTPDGRPLSNSPSATVAGPPEKPLTAEFKRMPGEHDGSTFTFRVKFSEDAKVTPRVLRETAFAVTGGRVRRAPRVNGRDDLREIHVEPSGYGTVSITLPATTDCSAAGAICTSDGRPLSNANEATVIGPVGISVTDARVKESAGAVLAFAVTLSRAATSAFTVDYATSDGTAQAGADYTATSGTLSVQRGASSATIEVNVLDDAHDEGEETLTLRLSNASGAHVADGEATGTIENADLMPAALLARIGRATAEQVVTHIEERMAAPRQRGFRARFAGRELQPGSERDFALGFLSSFAPMGAGPVGATPMGGAASMGMGSHAAGAVGTGTAGVGGAMGMTGQRAPMGGTAMTGYGPENTAHGGGLFGSMGMGGDLFSNSEFELNRESRGGMLSVWSRSSWSHFSGLDDALSLDGDVRTTMFGADYARGALTVGLSVGRTLGLGGYRGPSGGRMSTSMTGLYPWVGYQVNDRVSVWGVTGYGTGALSLTPDGQSALETGVSMAMSAVGTRGELIGSRATGGFALAFKADALWVGAASDLLDGPTGRLNASEAGVTRVRTALEGSRGFTLGGRLSLTPSVEVGLRRDGGDAETGAGMDVGGGLAFIDAVTGLSLDMRVRTLVMHQAQGFTERGMSLSFGWDPTPSSPLGLAAKVAPSWGGQAQGGAEALWGNQMTYGMGSHQMYGSGDRVDAEVGYGLPVGARLVGTPRVGLTTSQYGRDYRVGYGLGVLEQGNVNFELGVDAQRRESSMQAEASNGFMGRATLGW